MPADAKKPPSDDTGVPGIERHPDARVAPTARLDVGGGGRLILHAGCEIRDNAHIEVYDEGVVTIERGAVVGVNNWIQGNGDVTIGELACLGPNVVVLSTTHQADLAAPILHQPLSKRPTFIGCDVWIGANATVAAGVRISDHAVIGANSFVNRDIGEAAIAHGAPARTHSKRTATPKRLTIVFPVAVGFNDRPERCHAVARFFATMGNTLREIGVDCWHICHPKAASGLEAVRGDRKFIRDDHRDFGELLDRIRPDVMFLWNGATDAHAITRRFASDREIPIRYAELGWFPQSTTMHFDLEGTNARSAIRKLDLSRIRVDPTLDAWIDDWRRRQIGDAGQPSDAPAGYIFVPLQDERDTNITLASPYPTMDAFVTALSERFPRERFIVRPHPHYADVKITPRLNVQVTTEGALHAWLRGADAVVGINSTVLLEALAWDKPAHSVGVGLATGLDVMHEFDSVANLTIHRTTDAARRDRVRRLLSELIFRRQFPRKNLHYLDRLRRVHGLADLLDATASLKSRGGARTEAPAAVPI